MKKYFLNVKINMHHLWGAITILKTLKLKFLKNKTAFLAIIIATLTSAFILACYGFKQSEVGYECTSTAMGTYVTQNLSCKNAPCVCSDVNSEIKNLENKISWRIDSSDIQKINASFGETIDISKSTAQILSLSLDVAKSSGGAFNPTILPVSLLWNFDTGNNVPPLEQISQKLPYIDYNNLIVNCNTLDARKLSPHTAIDLGAVGKGAACDCALEIYKKNDVSCGIISVGGSIGVFGEKKDKSPFKIAIRNPFDETHSSANFATLSLKSGCISTSGSYEKSFCRDGKLYHHILDSNTGFPADTDLVSVTVIHDKGVLTDLLSTACFVLGKEKSLPLLSLYNASAVFVDSHKNVFVTKNLEEKFSLTDSSFNLCNRCRP